MNFKKTAETLIKDAHTLEQDYYINPDILQKEYENIFLKNWICAGRSSDLKIKGQYKVTEYPGFFINKHPQQDLCIPCCFNVAKSAKQHAAREKCGAEMWSPGGADPAAAAPKSFSKSKKESDIIKEGNKFPIDAGHWGFLPHNVYNFLNVTNTDSMCMSLINI